MSHPPAPGAPSHAQPAQPPGAAPAHAHAAGHGHHAAAEPLDLAERGAERDGAPQRLERRLFMQLLAFTAPNEGTATDYERELCADLEQRAANVVLYRDVNHPRGFALLSWSEDPAYFSDTVRSAFSLGPLSRATVRPELTMLGRTYSTGFESDLPFWLLERPVSTVTNAAWPWAVWYPLRRVGAFERLDGREKAGIMREHGTIGRSYGEADLAHDVRLACHGLDENDNEFVIGLVGKELYPLSHVVQSMRRTRQTAEFMQQMGPFFVGKAVYRKLGAKL